MHKAKKLNSPQFIVFFLSKRTSTVKPSKKTMYCDRSAYYQKAIKATARQLFNLLELAVAFFAFWVISFEFIGLKALSDYSFTSFLSTKPLSENPLIR